VVDGGYFLYIIWNKVL